MTGGTASSTGLPWHVIGVMTGTSIDGLDAVLVRVTGRGLSIGVELLDQYAAPLGDLTVGLRDAAAQKAMTARQFAAISRDFGRLHADAVAVIAGRHQNLVIDLVVAHGQTVVHDPPLTWQLLDPGPIVAAIAGHTTPVLTDLRRQDVASGGQGAPITPLADWVMFRSTEYRRAIVNLGGFCNASWLPVDDPSTMAVDQIRGGDICTCNHVLDGLAWRLLGQPYDDGGRAASTGRVYAPAAEALCKIIRRQSEGGRSLGTGDELIDAAAGALAESTAESGAALSPADRLATAADAVSRVIAESIACAHHSPQEVYFAGGGTRNAHFLRRLQAWLGSEDSSIQHVGTIDELGMPIDAREAAAMAVLGTLRLDGESITLPAVTGARSPHPAGSWSGPLPGDRVTG